MALADMRIPEESRHVPERPADDSLGDLRFRALIADDDWASLPVPVRRRFSKRLAGGRTVVYAGTVVDTRMSAIGWWLAQAARLIGGPLPTSRDAGLPAVVTVTEDISSGGQVWTRLYARRRGFPQIIHSVKRFAGRTGIEEYLGHGFGIALRVGACGGALVFRSNHYFFQMFGRRLRLPAWISPGTMTVIHSERGDGTFEFLLEVAHPRFGLLIRQSALFRESVP